MAAHHAHARGRDASPLKFDLHPASSADAGPWNSLPRIEGIPVATKNTGSGPGRHGDRGADPGRHGDRGGRGGGYDVRYTSKRLATECMR